MSQILWLGYKHRKSLLSINKQKVYDAIYYALKNCTKRISLKKNTAIDYPSIFRDVLYDNPILFHVGKFILLTSFDQVIIEPQYKMSPIRYFQIVSQIDEHVQDLIVSLKEGSNWDTINSLHSYIVDTLLYDEIGDDSHSVVGPATMRIGVCEGISKYVKLICDALCIKCVVISGRASMPGNELTNNSNHSWNAIQLTGVWYYFDFTFDLTLTGGSLKPGARRYDYYAIDQNSILIDHTNPDTIVKPVGSNHDYFSRHHMVARNEVEFINIVNRILNTGVFEMSVKISNSWKNFDLKKEMSKIAKQQNAEGLYMNKSILYAFNESQKICFLKFD